MEDISDMGMYLLGIEAGRRSDKISRLSSVGRLRSDMLYISERPIPR